MKKEIKGKKSTMEEKCMRKEKKEEEMKKRLRRVESENIWKVDTGIAERLKEMKRRLHFCLFTRGVHMMGSQDSILTSYYYAYIYFITLILHDSTITYFILT